MSADNPDFAELVAMALDGRPGPLQHALKQLALRLRRPLTRADVRSVFVGIRPLVRSGDARSTAALSRDHVIHIDPTGLVTLTGGKWTTWRSMAEHCVNTAAMLEHLPEKPCATHWSGWSCQSCFSHSSSGQSRSASPSESMAILNWRQSI